MSDLGAVADIVGGDVQGQQMAQGVDGQGQFGALLALGPVIAGLGPLSGVERRVRLSMIAAVGSASRPAASQRWVC